VVCPAAKTALQAAQAVRAESERPIRIAGCLPPLVANYHADQVPDDATCLRNYARLVDAQADGVDLLIAETMSLTTLITAGVVSALLLGFWQPSRRIDAVIETPRPTNAPGRVPTFHRGCFLLASASFCYSFVQLALSKFLGLLAFRLAGFSPVEAGLVLTVFHVSGIVGRPGWGIVADRVQHWGSVLPVIGLFTAGLTALLVGLTMLETAPQ
jgi:nitrate/nitrite transporter NarK